MAIYAEKGRGMKEGSKKKLSFIKKAFLKLRETDEQHQERLKEFEYHLDYENPDHRCFLCGNLIEEDPYIHHVIPYSYLNKDDLWNLVYTHKSCHEERNETMPDEGMVPRLDKRNLHLLKAMFDNEIMDQYVEELGYAVKYKLLYQEMKKIKGMLGNV
ncbi:MAG: HNH endonuclease signature motif containing protein [Bacillota bacterium]|nr:HNH endonuclease signature motif containing protein [Bacillota bacterium]